MTRTHLILEAYNGRRRDLKYKAVKLDGYDEPTFEVAFAEVGIDDTVPDYSDCVTALRDRGPRLAHGVSGRFALGLRSAAPPQRTMIALRISRRAHQRAQLHHRLVV